MVVERITANIDANDKVLIAKVRAAIKEELKLVPSYSDDLSLLRWIIGWDRKIDVVIPKLKSSLRAIAALELPKKDLSSIEKITEYCDSISKPLQYLPGSLLGYDKDHNIISIQMIGRLDPHGLMPCVKNSDLYVLRIAESEGVMNLIRSNEKKYNRQLGTTVIIDLEGLSMDMIYMPAIKVITAMLSQLQEMFPDVIRRIFIINSPSFIQFAWSLISSCLAKQTKQKIQFLGADWKERLKEFIDESVLYENWGGTRPAPTPYGHIRTGGKVPKELRHVYDRANDLPESELQKLVVSARSVTYVPFEVKGEIDPKRKLCWWWRLESGDVSFSILLAKDPSKDVAEDPEDTVIRPKFKLQTEYVPEEGQVSCELPGTYKLVFDNSHSTLRSKTLHYSVKTT
uniref:CRAL-TRIO domain-containing protein n=1 Tax=Syphacia muris TaxID=451379 RepID=A0A0N5ABX5_9BILA